MATPAKAKVDPKPMCKYGANCYRKSEQHLKNYRHPRDDVSLSGFLLILCLLSLLSVLLKEITSDIGAKMPCLSLSLSLSLSYQSCWWCGKPSSSSWCCLWGAGAINREIVWRVLKTTGLEGRSVCGVNYFDVINLLNPRWQGFANQ